MEPLESPRVEQVGGILSRGEDTDGERTDDEVDFPSETSYVSRYQEGEPLSQNKLHVSCLAHSATLSSAGRFLFYSVSRAHAKKARETMDKIWHGRAIRKRKHVLLRQRN